MKRFSTILGRSKKTSPSNSSAAIDNGGDTPEGTAARAVRLFCESGSTTNRDEEVLHLPPIVDAAESSPGAAAACAAQISAFLHKQYNSKPHVQYNAIMLVRILSDHPGASFTRNFDDKFVKSVKTLLREGKDLSVQQMMRETLDALEVNRASDPGVQNLVQMWRREKGKYGSLTQPQLPPRHHSRARGSSGGYGQEFGTGQAQSGQLPPPVELSSRIEEARNSAKILIQFLQTTPSEEIFTNELIKEFAERCQAASRSMQTYINSDDPVPDDNTLQTLIETNEQLSLANSRHQRAILAARRALGTGLSPGPDAARNASNASTAPQIPPPQQQQQGGFLQAAPRAQESGFGTFGSTANGTANGNSTVPVQAPAPVSLPSQTAFQAPSHQPKPSVDSRVSAVHNDDYDDLYDSPIVSRAPATNDPFADPVESASHTQQSIKPAQSNLTSATYSPGQPNTSPLAARPGPGPWHDSTVTDSFLGRQASAANGLTMHAPGTTGRAELDSHSNVGRT